MAGWWNGIHEGLKIPCRKRLEGSNPSPAIFILWKQDVLNNSPHRMFFCLTLLSLLGITSFQYHVFSAEKPPSFVFIMADDLGYRDLGCYGCNDIKTPNIDRLAHNGIRLTDFYTSAPVGTPSRCAFMTGRYQQRVPNMEWILDDGVMTAGLPQNELSIANILRHHGYSTGLIGKWHLGFKDECRPNQHGFDEFLGFLGGSIDYFRHVDIHGQSALYENTMPIKKEGYLTDLVTDKSLDFIDRHSNEPFFLQVAYNAPHWPIQGPDDKDEKVSRNNEWDTKGDRDTYAKMVERMDEGVGKILKRLQRKGIRKNTLVVFCSDNGGGRWSNNLPLKKQKARLWEGGIRVPCIISWPKQLPAGRVSTQATIIMDLTASMLAAAGIEQPRRLDGFDILSHISGEREEIDRTFVWRNDFHGEKAVRWGKWKWLHENGKDFLFDLDKDPGEENDVKDRFFDILFLVKEVYRKWEDAMPYPQTMFGEEQQTNGTRDK